LPAIEELGVLSYNNSGNSNLQRRKNSAETIRVRGMKKLKETEE
jgi:hypothetical protein